MNKNGIERKRENEKCIDEQRRYYVIDIFVRSFNSIYSRKHTHTHVDIANQKGLLAFDSF